MGDLKPRVERPWRLRSPRWATGLFVLGYLLGTALGFAAFAISPVVMWVSMALVMVPTFAALIRCYLARTACPPARSLGEVWRLALYWVLASFMLDAVVYIAVIPAAIHAAPRWTFFLDQSPWIWWCYASLAVSAWAGWRMHVRSLAPVKAAWS